MAMATLSASCRSSEGESLRSLMRFRILSRASWNSLSSLACSGQLIARVEEEHIRHLLKTPRRKIAERRRKGKHYFRLLFALLILGSQLGDVAPNYFKTCLITERSYLFGRELGIQARAPQSN